MKINDAMTRNVQVEHPDATIHDAALKMKAHDIGFLPVCDGQMLVGVLTDRDIVVRAAAEGFDPSATRVRLIMTPRPVYCFDDEDLTIAARKMEEGRIRRMIVLNRDKRLVGVVSLGDLAERNRDEHLTAEVLERVCEPTPAGGEA